MRGRERGQRQSSLPSSLVRHLRSGPRSPDSATSKDESAQPPETQDGGGMRARERDNARTPSHGLAQPLATAPPATSFPLRPIAPSFPVQSSFPDHGRRTSLPPLRRESEPQHPSRSYGRGWGDEHAVRAPSSSSIPHGQPSRQVSPWSTDPEYYTYPPPTPRHLSGQYAAPSWSEGEPGPSTWTPSARPLSQSSYRYDPRAADPWPNFYTDYGQRVERAESFSRGEGYDPRTRYDTRRMPSLGETGGYDQRAGYEVRRGYPLADARVADAMQGWASGPEYNTSNHYPTLPSPEQSRAQRQPNEFQTRAQPVFPEPSYQTYDQHPATRSPVASGSQYPYVAADYELSPELALATPPRADELPLAGESSSVNGETKDPYFEHGFPFGDGARVASPPEERSEDVKVQEKRRVGTGKRKHRRAGTDEGSLEGALRGVKRAKTEIACDFCRQRKLKCSGDRPLCRACTNRKLECRYASEPRRRGPGKALKGSRTRTSKARKTTFALSVDTLPAYSETEAAVFPALAAPGAHAHGQGTGTAADDPSSVPASGGRARGRAASTRRASEPAAEPDNGEPGRNGG